MEQRLAALSMANATRSQRAMLLRDLRQAKRDPQAIVKRVPSYMQSCPVGAFLKAVPGIGSVRVRRIVKRLQIDGDKRLGTLTERQRNALAEEIQLNRRKEQG